MFLLVIFIEFVAFPQRKDTLLKSEMQRDLIIEASGSIGLHIDGKCQQTFPNQTIIGDKRIDWCSNIANGKDEKPWIQYYFKGRKMSIYSFSVRNGCCHGFCCCLENDELLDRTCCCSLYSYSLLGSNDNKTWDILYKVEKDSHFYDCEAKTFELNKKSEYFTFIRFVLDDYWPGCLKCMQVNQIELYGDATNSASLDSSDDDEESISIIGRVNKDI